MTTRKIIDTHTHLYDLADPKAMLCQAALDGVTEVVALGVDLASNQAHVSLQQKQGEDEARMYLGLGMHPGNITDTAAVNDCLQFVRSHINLAVAIGETGLDFWYQWVRKDEGRKQQQRQSFALHLELAVQYSLPIVIHSRGAWQECLSMTRQAGIRRADFHWYSGPVEVLKDILDAGYYISVSPALEYSPEARRAAEYAPLDRLFIETDTPVAVRPAKGERRPSTPSDVWRTLELLCEIKKLNEREVLEAVNHNARSFFRLPML